MGAVTGLSGVQGCLPQGKPACSSPSLETSPNLQASGAGGEGGGVTHWSAAAPGLVLVIGPQITWGREDCVLPGEGLEGALWEADACPQGQRQACPAAFREQRM